MTFHLPQPLLNIGKLVLRRFHCLDITHCRFLLWQIVRHMCLTLLRSVSFPGLSIIILRIPAVFALFETVGYPPVVGLVFHQKVGDEVAWNHH